jgi:hypothetical protein
MSSASKFHKSNQQVLQVKSTGLYFKVKNKHPNNQGLKVDENESSNKQPFKAKLNLLETSG